MWVAVRVRELIYNDRPRQLTERRNNRPVAVRFDKTMKEAHLLEAAMPHSEGACSRIMSKKCVVSKTLLFENQLNWCEFRTIIIVLITINTCNMTTITRRRE